MIKITEKGYSTIVLVLVLGLIFLGISITLLNTALTKDTLFSEEKMSDNLLVACDLMLDNTLLTISDFPKFLSLSARNVNSDIYKNLSIISTKLTDENMIKKASAYYVLSFLLSKINGGEVVNLNNSLNPYQDIGASYSNYIQANKTPGSLWDILDNYGTYLYDLSDKRLYKVVGLNSNGIYYLVPNLSEINGSTLLQEFYSSNVYRLSDLDYNFKINSRWIVIRTNVQYNDDNGSNGEFQIRITAYYLSSPNRIRSIYSSAKIGSILAQIIKDYTNNITPPAFNHAVWSGNRLTINGALNIYSGNISPNGTYTPTYTNGDLYVDGNIVLNGNPRIYGNLITSQPQEVNPITITGAPYIQGQIIYNQKESLPEIPLPLEEQIKQIASSYGAIQKGSLSTYSNYTLIVNGRKYDGTNVPYYIDGSLTLNATGNVKINSTSSNPPVALYVNGDLTFNGDCTLEFNSPGVIWVNGDVIFNGTVKIKGSGTIISTKKIQFNGAQRIKYLDDKSISALVSLGQGTNGGIVVNGNVEYHGLMYAPYSNITFNGNSTIFGAVIGGGYGSTQGVTFNGSQNIVYDNRLANNTISPPPLMGEPLKYVNVSFEAFSSSGKVLRNRWAEIITKTVSENYVSSLNPIINIKM
ncbi:DUF7305 domain-containing protein [Dictyoglomus sp.]|uniref:DUF7305 domain-containing protein n=1 Tax=Dictyoglomus sp. TaxID=28205 RepID=UPI003D10E60A